MVCLRKKTTCFSSHNIHKNNNILHLYSAQYYNRQENSFIHQHFQYYVKTYETELYTNCDENEICLYLPVPHYKTQSIESGITMLSPVQIKAWLVGREEIKQKNPWQEIAFKWPGKKLS